MPGGNVSLRMHTTSPYRRNVSIFVLMINQVRHLKKTHATLLKKNEIILVLFKLKNIKKTI